MIYVVVCLHLKESGSLHRAVAPLNDGRRNQHAFIIIPSHGVGLFGALWRSAVPSLLVTDLERYFTLPALLWSLEGRRKEAPRLLDCILKHPFKKKHLFISSFFLQLPL